MSLCVPRKGWDTNHVAGEGGMGTCCSPGMSLQSLCHSLALHRCIWVVTCRGPRDTAGVAQRGQPLQ